MANYQCQMPSETAIGDGALELCAPSFTLKHYKECFGDGVHAGSFCRVVIVCGMGFVLRFPAMNKDTPPSATKRHQQFRKFGAYRNFEEADAELRAYWRSRTPQERMEALEELRILNYGQEAIDARIPRVFGVPEPRRS